MASTSNLVIIDASVVVKWFIPGEVLEPQASSLYTRFSDGALEFTAPDHIFNEVASALTFASRGNSARLLAHDARLVLRQFLDLDLPTVQTNQLLLPAFDLVHRHGTSIYDSLYLARSDALQVPLVTADERFIRIVHQDHHVLWLGDIELN